MACFSKVGSFYKSSLFGLWLFLRPVEPVLMSTVSHVLS